LYDFWKKTIFDFESIQYQNYLSKRAFTCRQRVREELALFLLLTFEIMNEKQQWIFNEAIDSLAMHNIKKARVLREMMEETLEYEFEEDPANEVAYENFKSIT